MVSNRYRIGVVGAALLMLMAVTAVAQDAPQPAPAPTGQPGPGQTPPAVAEVGAAVQSPQAAAVVVPLNNPGGARLGDLDRIQSEILLAEARTKLAQAKKSLAEATGAEIDGGGLPVVAGVFGPASKPYARFLMEGGTQMIGREGDTIGGGFRVVRIGVDRVVIKDRNGREVVARFSGTAPVSSPSAGASGGSNPAVLPSNGLTPFPSGR